MKSAAVFARRIASACTRGNDALAKGD